MSEFSHYEADQSALYSGGHHQDASSAESKGKVKKIWIVTGILTIVTIVEVGLGLYGHSVGMPKSMINTFFILLTLFKAGYIVKVFMHLGDEKKTLRNVILIPYFLFVLYLIFIALWEALAISDALQLNAI